jgi:hypothetical protein
LLRDLGTNNVPMSTPEINLLWREGLTRLVKELRGTAMGRDVNAIALRIVKFRSEFAGSPDVILGLEGL